MNNASIVDVGTFHQSEPPGIGIPSVHSPQLSRGYFTWLKILSTAALVIEARATRYAAVEKLGIHNLVWCGSSCSFPREGVLGEGDVMDRRGVGRQRYLPFAFKILVLILRRNT